MWNFICFCLTRFYRQYDLTSKWHGANTRGKRVKKMGGWGWGPACGSMWHIVAEYDTLWYKIWHRCDSLWQMMTDCDAIRHTVWHKVWRMIDRYDMVERHKCWQIVAEYDRLWWHVAENVTDVAKCGRNVADCGRLAEWHVKRGRAFVHLGYINSFMSFIKILAL